VVSEGVEAVNPCGVVSGVVVAGGDVVEAWEPFYQGGEALGKAREVAGRDGDEDAIFGVCGHVIKGQVAHTFGLPCTVWIAHAPLGNQGAEAAIGCAVTRVGEEGFACDEGDAGTCDRADVDRFRVGIMAHGACEAVDVCATELVVTLRPSGGGKVHGIRCAAQKGKAGGKTKLDKGGGRIWRVFTVLRDGATLKCVVVFRHGV